MFQQFRLYIYAGCALALVALLGASGLGLYRAGYKSAAYEYEQAMREAADSALAASHRNADSERARAASAADARSAADRLADEVIADAIRSATADCDIDRMRLDQLDAAYSGRAGAVGMHGTLPGASPADATR